MSRSGWPVDTFVRCFLDCGEIGRPKPLWAAPFPGLGMRLYKYREGTEHKIACVQS